MHAPTVRGGWEGSTCRYYYYNIHTNLDALGDGVLFLLPVDGGLHSVHRLLILLGVSRRRQLFRSRLILRLPLLPLRLLVNCREAGRG